MAKGLLQMLRFLNGLLGDTHKRYCPGLAWSSQLSTLKGWSISSSIDSPTGFKRAKHSGNGQVAGNGEWSLTAEHSPLLVTSKKVGVSVLQSQGTEFC